MKTICIDCRYLGDRPSGIGEVVRGLVDHLPGLAPEMGFMLLRNPAHPGRLSSADNVVEQVVSAPANGPGTMWFLPRIVDLTGVDLFHATFNIMPAGLAMPCVTTVHDIMWLAQPHLCSSGPRGWLDRWFYGQGMERALRSASAITTVSKASADAMVQLAPSVSGRVHVARPGPSPRFRPLPAEAATLSGLGLSPDRRFVLTVGQYAPYKNHEGALRGFAHAFAGEEGIDLVLVQRRGGNTRRLLDLAGRLGIEGRVHILPTVGADTLIALYSSAAALLHPSFCEGFGMPLVEAMACGCPVVTADASAMPEVTGGAALLADPRDPASIGHCLRRVVSDAGLAAAMREKGLARVREITWAKFAARHLDVYREVLGSASATIRRASSSR